MAYLGIQNNSFIEKNQRLSQIRQLGYTNFISLSIISFIFLLSNFFYILKAERLKRPVLIQIEHLQSNENNYSRQETERNPRKNVASLQTFFEAETAGMTGRNLLDTDRFDTGNDLLGRKRKKTENNSIDTDSMSRNGKKNLVSENLSLNGSNMVSNRITSVRYLNDPANVSTTSIPNLHHLNFNKLKAGKTPSANQIVPSQTLSMRYSQNLQSSLDLPSSPIKEDQEQLEQETNSPDKVSTGFKKSKFNRNRVTTKIDLKDVVNITGSSIEFNNSIEATQTFGMSTHTPNVAMKSTMQLFQPDSLPQKQGRSKIQELEDQIKRVRQRVFYDKSQTHLSKQSQSKFSVVIQNQKKEKEVVKESDMRINDEEQDVVVQEVEDDSLDEAKEPASLTVSMRDPAPKTKDTQRSVLSPNKVFNGL